MALVWHGKEALGERRQRIATVRSAIAGILLAHAKENAPVDTGNLRDSGVVIELDDTATLVAFPTKEPEPRKHGDHYYSQYVELGTVEHAPNPFLRTAILDTIPEAKALLNAR